MEEEWNLGPRQKAAAILLSLENDRASKIISHFRTEEIQAMMLASEGMTSISQDALEQLVDEFEEECNKGAGLVDSSIAFHSLIEEALTPEQFGELTVGPEASQIALKNNSIWDLLETLEDSELIDFLISENAYVSAYVLSRLPAKKAAGIIGQLEPSNRQKIVAGMMTSRPASSDAVAMLEEIVTEQFGRAISADKSSGNQHLVAGMMNELDMELSDNLFEELEQLVQPKQLQAVRSLMFRFEDILSLESASRSALFDKVGTETTTLALRGASPEIRECVLSSIGQRTRRMMEAELESDMAIPQEEIKAAQKQIANTVLILASEGTVTIPAPDIAA